MEKRVINTTVAGLNTPIDITIYTLTDHVPEGGYLGQTKYPMENIDAVIKELIESDQLPITTDEINIIQCGSRDGEDLFLIQLIFGI